MIILMFGTCVHMWWFIWSGVYGVAFPQGSCCLTPTDIARALTSSQISSVKEFLYVWVLSHS